MYARKLMKAAQQLRKVGVILGLPVSESTILNYSLRCRSNNFRCCRIISQVPDFNLIETFSLDPSLSMPCNFFLITRYSVFQLFWQSPNSYQTLHYQPFFELQQGFPSYSSGLIYDLVYKDVMCPISHLHDLKQCVSMGSTCKKNKTYPVYYENKYVLNCQAHTFPLQVSTVGDHSSINS